MCAICRRICEEHEGCNKIDKGFPVRGLILKTPVEGLACEVSSERGSIQKF